MDQKNELHVYIIFNYRAVLEVNSDIIYFKIKSGCQIYMAYGFRLVNNVGLDISVEIIKNTNF